MKKILLQLGAPYSPLGVGSAQAVGVFDAVMAYDAGVDCVLPLGNVRPQDVPALVHETVFARPAADLRSLAMFIGGSDVAAGEALLKAIQAAFFGPMRVSVMLDSSGCNTTAAAVVAKTADALSAGDARGKRAVVLAGTGPVGFRTAALLAREGFLVTLTSRRLSHAKATCAAIRERFGVPVGAAQVTAAECVRALEKADLVVATGAAGVTLLPETVWRGHQTLRILADVNAVPPLGIEGIEATWNGHRLGEGGRQVVFGALGIGALKKRTQHACLTRLFERNDQVFDGEEIGRIARELDTGVQAPPKTGACGGSP